VLSRPLQWKSRNDAVGSTLVALHRTLATARAHHAALRSAHIWPEQQDGWQTQFDPDGFGADLDRQAVVYHRWAALPDGRTETVIVVLNFSDAEQRLTVPFPSQGRWTDLLGGFDGAPWEVEVRGSHADVPVGSHWGRLLNHVG
jgi:hypothetical protein